jgi:hypothetical protein
MKLYPKEGLKPSVLATQYLIVFFSCLSVRLSEGCKPEINGRHC